MIPWRKQLLEGMVGAVLIGFLRMMTCVTSLVLWVEILVFPSESGYIQAENRIINCGLPSDVN